MESLADHRRMARRLEEEPRQNLALLYKVVGPDLRADVVVLLAFLVDQVDDNRARLPQGDVVQVGHGVVDQGGYAAVRVQLEELREPVVVLVEVQVDGSVVVVQLGEHDGDFEPVWRRPVGY